MQVSGPLLDREPEKIIYRAHDRSAAGEIAQIIDVVFARCRLALDGRTWTLRLDLRCECRVDVLCRRDGKDHGASECDLYGANGFGIHGPRNCQGHAAGCILVRKKAPLLQKARRELRSGKLAADQIAALHAITAKKTSELVGKSGGGQFGVADPINVAEPVHCTRVELTFEDLWRLAQRALARQVGDKRVGQLQIARAILRLAGGRGAAPA